MNEKELKEAERRQARQQRMKAGLEAAILEARDRSTFWNDHLEIRSRWHMFTQHYGSYFLAHATIDNDGISLMPVSGRASALDTFWAEIEQNIDLFATTRHLSIDRTAGTTMPVELLTGDGTVLHTGWQWRIPDSGPTP
jgi:hypothetical protein